MLDPASNVVVVSALVGSLCFIAGWVLHGIRGRRGLTADRGLTGIQNRLDLVVAHERDRSLASSAKVAELGHSQRITRLEQDLGDRSAQVAALREETARLARLRHSIETKLARNQEELAARGEELAAALARIKALESPGRASNPAIRPTDDRLPEHIEALERKLKDAAERAADMATAHAAAMKDEQHARHRLQQRLAELEPQVVRLRDLQLQLADSERRHAGAAHDQENEFRRLRARNAELESIVKQRDELERALQAREAELRHHAARVEKLEGLLPDHERCVALEAEVAALKSLLSDRDREVADLRELGRPRPPAARPSLPNVASLSTRRRHRPPADRDDLQRIHGIGPVLERRLHRLGIVRFGQIARWTGEDIERIADQLDDSVERIRRDRWVQSARREHTRKYGHDPLTGAAVEQS